jgi:SSS family solute:Na+ symporter
MLDYTLVSIALYGVLMLAIGYYAMKTSTADNNEYLLGGRKVSAKVTALSAGASDMSGWMLMGLPGAAFVSGLDSIWLGVGLLLGAYANYQIVAPRLRVYTEYANDSLTIPEFFAQRFNRQASSLRLIAALIIILFFTLYTASGLVAGGKLFESAFGYQYSSGIYLTLSVVIIYTLLGGFLAVSLTDFVQGCIMFIALVLVPLSAFSDLPANTPVLTEQVGEFVASLNNRSTLEWLSVVGLMSWGLGYFGQPHIVVRFMAIESHHKVKDARRIGISWMTITLIGALMTGIIGHLWITAQQQAFSDPETIFIFLSQQLFHPLIGGWLLAAILAAIMSTISSQLLVSASSLVEDAYRIYFYREASADTLLWVSRLSVLVVAVVAMMIALSADQSVLNLVSHAWAGFGSAFGPVILFALLWRRMTHQGAIAGVLTGAIVVMVWTYAPVMADGATLGSVFYGMIPGFVASSLAIYLVSKFTPQPCDRTQQKFDDVQQLLEPSHS